MWRSIKCPVGFAFRKSTTWICDIELINRLSRIDINQARGCNLCPTINSINSIQCLLFPNSVMFSKMRDIFLSNVPFINMKKKNLFPKLTRKVPYFAGMNDLKIIFLVSNKLQQILNGLTNSCIMFQGSVWHLSKSPRIGSMSPMWCHQVYWVFISLPLWMHVQFGTNAGTKSMNYFFIGLNTLKILHCAIIFIILCYLF